MFLWLYCLLRDLLAIGLFQEKSKQGVLRIAIVTLLRVSPGIFRFEIPRLYLSIGIYLSALR